MDDAGARRRRDDLSESLLRLLGPIPAEFRALAERCGATRVDVFAGIFGMTNQSSIELSEAAVAALAERRLAIIFDCYVRSEDEDSQH